MKIINKITAINVVIVFTNCISQKFLLKAFLSFLTEAICLLPYRVIPS